MPELAIDPRTVGGAFGVDEMARRLINYKFAENACMTAAGGWASSMPLIKVKFALGEHCYQDSIHSFWIGQRLPEVRVTDEQELEQLRRALRQLHRGRDSGQGHRQTSYGSQGR